jgi:hypothetical protein
MPSSPGYVRDYKAEAKYEAKPEQKAKRASRGRARYALAKKGKVRLGDGLDVDHKNGNALDNNPSNWKVESKRSNRSYPRDHSAHKKYQTA